MGDPSRRLKVAVAATDNFSRPLTNMGSSSANSFSSDRGGGFCLVTVAAPVATQLQVVAASGELFFPLLPHPSTFVINFMPSISSLLEIPRAASVYTSVN